MKKLAITVENPAELPTFGGRKVVDGKLYLNYNKHVREKWQHDYTERIVRGQAN